MKWRTNSETFEISSLKYCPTFLLQKGEHFLFMLALSSYSTGATNGFIRFSTGNINNN